MLDINSINSIVTHGGVFHCDDVAAVALVELAAGHELPVSRVFKVPADVAADVLVVDIGGGMYDHHQPEAEIRPSGDKYAAVGLLYRELKGRLLPDEKAQWEFEEDYILPIERQDNLGPAASNPLSLAVGALNPNWDSTESGDAAFRDAVNLVKRLFAAVIDRYWAAYRAKDVLDAAQKIGRVAVLDRFAPVDRWAVAEGVSIVAYPGLRGGWNLKTVLGSGLKELPPTPDAQFRHPAGFLAQVADKDYVIAWARKLY